MNIYLSTLPLYISYEKGGHWINHGLPMKVAINRKPENGCEIQNTCCGRNMIMMRLKLLKTAEEQLTHTFPDSDTGIIHSTYILLLFVGYSYFMLVGATEELEKLKMGFIGVVKNSTRRFPMAYLSRLERIHFG